MSKVKRNGIDVSLLDHKIYFLKYPFLKSSVKEDITTQHVQKVHRDYSVKKTCLLVRPLTHSMMLNLFYNCLNQSHIELYACTEMADNMI